MKSIAIVGYGRFGRVLHRLLKNDFIVTPFTKTDDIKKIYENDVIFYAVPIEKFEQVIRTHKKYFRPENLLIDVLSVKMHPEKIFRKFLVGTKTQAMLTHPMFGPDSSKNGFDGLPMIMDQFKSSKTNYDFWKNYFTSKKLQVIEMSAKEHDRLAANSQGLTHFIGRLLHSYGLKSTLIDSLGTKKLLEVIDQTCNDTWQLFTNLQHYNPYTKAMRMKLGQKYDLLYNALLPKHVTPGRVTYGIQGGKGSFNEEALKDYVTKHRITRYSVKYLYTSENVLCQLHKGTIDYGLFAVHNPVGGVVWESVKAMGTYKFTILEEFAIPIRHTLMKRKDAKATSIDRIMAHPQVFAQCQKTLAEKYPNLVLESGIGNMVDTAKAAYALAHGGLPRTYAILGPKTLSVLFDFDVIDENLQDDKENLTSFFLVER